MATSVAHVSCHAQNDVRSKDHNIHILYNDLKQRANISQANISQLSITCISLCVSKARVHIYTKTLRGPIPNGGICRIYPLSVPQVRLNAGCSSHMIPRANDVTPLIVLEHSFGRVFPGSAQFNRAAQARADPLAPARARTGWIDHCTGTLSKLPVRHRNAWFVYCTGTLPIVLEHSYLTRQSISASGQVHAWADPARADPPVPASTVWFDHCIGIVWQIRHAAQHCPYRHAAQTTCTTS